MSNQDGLGTEKYPTAQFEMIQSLLLRLLESQGIRFESVFICPHFEREKCFCRKPHPGMVQEYLASPSWDRERSYMIGDRVNDLGLAENMKIQGIQIGPQRGWKAIARQLLSVPRVGRCARKTKETEISVQVSLDEAKIGPISTGIGFFDHMLEQISHHGSFGASIQVKGDLHIDDHHTIEDTAIALGTALKQALGDKVGIERFGFYLPMDDSSAQVALDLSGRSYFQFEGRFARDEVGGLSTEMVPHFFRSFSDALGANLHLKITGENTHHQVEAAFKAVGRCLKMAVQQSRSGELPTTKGLL